jgi:hypothetical protein
LKKGRIVITYLFAILLSFVLSVPTGSTATPAKSSVMLKSKNLNGSLLVPTELSKKIVAKDEDGNWYFYYKNTKTKKNEYIFSVVKGKNYPTIMANTDCSCQPILLDSTGKGIDIYVDYGTGTEYSKEAAGILKQLKPYFVTYEPTIKVNRYFTSQKSWKSYNGKWGNKTDDFTYEVKLGFKTGNKATIDLMASAAYFDADGGVHYLNDTSKTATVTFNNYGIGQINFLLFDGSKGTAFIFLQNGRVKVNINGGYGGYQALFQGNKTFTKAK